MRDDFSAKTIRLLQGQVGYCCSNPDCRRVTIGPAVEQERTVNIGVAAHITAASEGGPRYDGSLASPARKSAGNGIWLCQVCAKLIDSDPARYTVDLLHGWKREALARAFKAIATSTAPRPAPPSGAISDVDDAEFLARLGLPVQDTVDAVATKMRDAAEDDAATFRSARDWPVHAIELNLSVDEGGTHFAATLDGLSAAAGSGITVNLVAPPGTGKSTTLVQLAERMSAANEFVPLIVPLGEWSDRTDDFFDFLLRRNVFRAFRRQHFMQLAYFGRIALILDGWNELDPTSRTRAVRDLEALRREYPQLTIFIGTRRHTSPLEGWTVEIGPLSEDQQLEIARAQRGTEGEALVDQAWRSEGLRDLIAIPLYINALLALPQGSRFPETKEEVLRLFVNTHEQEPTTAEVLRNELHGCHDEILAALGAAANQQAGTSIAESLARQTISSSENRLFLHGQLTTLPQPSRVLDVLVGQHLLVRPSGPAGAVMFQHQQFQEWYASYEVERLMLESAAGDETSRGSLREQVLDWPDWEESILFACERLSRREEAARAGVAHAIRETLGIDPVLAAEMISRATVDVWDEVKHDVLAFIDLWHLPDRVDRATRFMITSGRPEFAEHVWPLVSHENTQVHLSALRAADRFRPAVLGPDARKRLAALPDKVRSHVLSEIADNSDYDGMDLVCELAQNEQNPRVVVRILQAFALRRADHHVTKLLRNASDEVWGQLVREGYPDELAATDLQQRLENERKAAKVQDRLSPRALASLASLGAHDSDAEARIVEIIRSPAFSPTDSSTRDSLHRASETAPEVVARALMLRLGDGLEMPYNAPEYLRAIQTVDDGPIKHMALNDAAPARLRSVALTVIGADTVQVLLDSLLTLHDAYAAKAWKIDDTDRRKYHDSMDAVLSTRPQPFADAFLARADTHDPERIALLAKLLTRHGKGTDEGPLAIAAASKEDLVNTVLSWMGVLLTDPQANRHEMSDVAWAIPRLPDQRFVPGLQEMLERDLADQARAREEYLRTRHGSPSPDVTSGYTNIYQAAFSAIGGGEVAAVMKQYLGNLQFGVGAAQVLAAFWESTHRPRTKEQVRWQQKYGGVGEQRARRQDPNVPPATTDFAEWIFDTARAAAAKQTEPEMRHAIALGRAGLYIAHGSKRTHIDSLLQLPLPYAAKQGLLRAAALAGETLEADIIFAGLQELLKAAEKDAWRLEDNRGELMGWLELFAFSDDPQRVVKALELVPAEYRRPWKLRSVIDAFGYSPYVGAVDALDQIARTYPEAAREYDWLIAVVKLGTERAAFVLLEHVCDGSSPGSRGGADAWHISEYLANFGRTFPAFRAELMRRYEIATQSSSSQILEHALAHLADGAIILKMVAAHAAQNRSFRQGHLLQALRNVAIARQPLDDAGTFEQYGTAATGLRKALLALAIGGGQQAELAEHCLNYIDELRDEYGRIADEPRHPDISSDKLWPLLQRNKRT
jgi:hypothetical protein